MGMGRDLAAAFPEAKRTFEEADEVLGYALTRVAWEGPEAQLTETRNAQPAILTHSLAVWRVVAEQVGPVAVAAGHSLGEFSAHAASGALRMEDALRTVRRRAELMHRSGVERPGTMAALLGVEDAVAVQLCRDASSGGEQCVAANFNAPGQVVISGDVAAVQRAVELATGAGAKALPLSVSGAFHSPLMESAEAGLAAELETVELLEGAFGVVSNVTGGVERERGRIRTLLIEQLTSPVRWTTCVHTMLESGVRRFLEPGPGKVLTGLLRRIDREAKSTPLGTVVDVEAFMASAS